MRFRIIHSPLLLLTWSGCCALSDSQQTEQLRQLEPADESAMPKTKLVRASAKIRRLGGLKTSKKSFKQDRSDVIKEHPSEVAVPESSVDRSLATSSPSYKILTSAEIATRLTTLARNYPNFIRVTTAQKRYGLAAAGGYANYILFMQDYTVHPQGSASSNALPEVFLSGALHGDERVGPTAVVETASLLAYAASCESSPTVTCKTRLSDMGIDDANRQWLARLVTTRRIVIVPTANALGYARGVREEGTIDPNRDFAFDQDPDLCMRSIAARTINELFREHQFQLSITFHGGIEVISYEWGNTAYAGTSSVSPDDLAQRQISAAYSNFGGAFQGSPKYPYGISNEVVYYVEGGFEDYAYGGSWHPTLKVQCTPSTYGGYPKSKTTYSSGMLRAFNILIETSNDKSPSQSALGGPQNLMSPNARAGNGYVARNIRTSLLAIDLVEPYVSMEQVNSQWLARDLIPKWSRNGRACRSTKAVAVSPSSSTSVKFTVGGALTVDDVEVWYGKWSDIPQASLNCLSQPSRGKIQSYLMRGTMVGSTSGTGRFANGGGAATIFQATLNLSGFAPGDSIVVVAAAKVDSRWGDTDPSALPKVGPQSHIVNARTNPNWLSKNNNKVIKGRTYWFSDPLTLTIA